MINNDQALRKIVRHAYETVPFYQRLMDGDAVPEPVEIDKLPIVDKGCMAGFGDSMLSSGYIGKYIGKQLSWTRTSGSSGILHEVYWDDEDERKSLKSLWLLRKKYYGISPRQKLCYFFPSDMETDKYMETECVLAVSRSALYDGSMEEAYQKIRQYRPDWMILQPSIALLLCRLAEEDGIWDNLRYIEFTGEYLELPLRHRVEAVFGCRTANQYGTKEVNSIAYECPEGNMHVMSDNVYLETAGENLCVTSLRNYAMPFVRYRLDDRGEISRGVSCACGRCGDILTLRTGRSDDFIKLADGGVMHAYALMQIVQHVNYQYEGCIMQYQIIQKDYDHFVFKLVLVEDECKEEMKEILPQMIARGVNQRMNVDCETDVWFEEEIFPEEKTGKCRIFRTEVA